MLRQCGSHGNGRGIGDAAEGGRAGGDARGAQILLGGGTLGLKHVSGVFQKGPPVVQVLVLQDLEMSGDERTTSAKI